MNKKEIKFNEDLYNWTRDIVLDQVEYNKLNSFLKSPQNTVFFNDSPQGKLVHKYLKAYKKQWEQVIEFKREYRDILRETQEGK